MHSKPQTYSSPFCTRSRSATAALATAIVLVLTGAVAQSAQAQTYQVLYNFTGGQDGAYPEAGLTMDGGGNLYGTAYQGGSMNRGTVYKLAHRGTGWALSPLYNFTGQGDGGAPIAGVVFGPNGTLYGTTEFAGQDCGEGCGVVFNVRPPTAICKTVICPWTETVIYSFRGDTDGANPGYGDLTFDQAGNIYGTTYFGGTNSQGVVYKLTPSNGKWTESAIHTFSGASDGENPYSSVIFDTSGNLYGTTFAGGAHGYGTVYQLTPNGSNWTENTLYAFQSATNGGKPFGGVVFDTAGNLYGATSSGGSGSGGTAYELMPSNGSWTFDLLYSFTGSAYLPGSYGSLTKDSAGNFYGTTVKDGANGVGSVFKLTPSNGGWTLTDLYDFAGGSDGEIPYGSVLIDASGNLYGTASGGGANGYGVIWEITP
ncbi:MAG: choice-of-anchor tandem repeat GloVer-containing protein [Candidatus Korobacteraceae bacterium]|jgi:uncharacterized repeat protein (TIGR03803 family)